MRDGDTQFLYTELGNWGMEDPDFTLYISRGGWKIASDHRGFADSGGCLQTDCGEAS